MARRYRIVTFALLGCAWSAACNTFNDDLEARIPTGSGYRRAGGTDGSGGTDGVGARRVTAGTDGSGASGSGGASGTRNRRRRWRRRFDVDSERGFLRGRDSSSDASSGHRFLHVNTTGLRNDFSNLIVLSASRASLPETDAFFKVIMRVGVITFTSGPDRDAGPRGLPARGLQRADLRRLDRRVSGGKRRALLGRRTQDGTYFLGIDGISTSATTVPHLSRHAPTCGNVMRRRSRGAQRGLRRRQQHQQRRLRRQVPKGVERT